MKLENVVPLGRNLEEYQKMFQQNQKSKYLKPILDILKDKGFEAKLIKTNYEFQKGANELLSIKVYNKF